MSCEEVSFRRCEMIWEPYGVAIRVGFVVACARVLVWVDVRKVLAILRPSVSALSRYPWGMCGHVSDMEGIGREVGDCTRMAVRHQRAQ